MASKQTYECFVCKKNGFAAVMVYLAGKDDMGRAIRLEDDGVTPHQHKTKVPSQQLQQQAAAAAAGSTTESPQLRIMNAKLDRIIALLESELKKEDSASAA